MDVKRTKKMRISAVNAGDPETPQEGIPNNGQLSNGAIALLIHELRKSSAIPDYVKQKLDAKYIPQTVELENMDIAVVLPIIVVKDNDLKHGQFTMTNPNDWDAMQNGARMPDNVSELLTEDNETLHVVNVMMSEDLVTTNTLVDVVTNLQSEFSSVVDPGIVKDIALKTMSRTMDCLEGNDYIPQFTTHVLMEHIYEGLDT